MRCKRNRGDELAGDGLFLLAEAQSKEARAKRDNIRLGCSEWSYAHWRGLFYPREQSPQEWFAFYSMFFDTIEINNTFYHDARRLKQLAGLPTRPLHQWH